MKIEYYGIETISYEKDGVKIPYHDGLTKSVTDKTIEERIATPDSTGLTYGEVDSVVDAVLLFDKAGVIEPDDEGYKLFIGRDYHKDTGSRILYGTELLRIKRISRSKLVKIFNQGFGNIWFMGDNGNEYNSVKKYTIRLK